MRKNLKLVLGFIGFLYITGSAFAIENNIYEQCFINKVKDNKTGYSYIARSESKTPSNVLVRTNKYTELEFQKYGLPIKMISNVEYIETYEGKPFSIKATIESLDNKTVYNAKFLEGNQIELETITRDNTTNKVIEYKGKILLPFAISKLFKASTLDQIKYQTLDLSSDFRIVNITATKENKESIVANEKEVLAIKYKVIADVLPNVGNYQWFDKQGHILKEFSSLLNIEQVATLKKNVLKQEVVSNLYYDNLIPVDSHLENIKDIRQITYKITSSVDKSLKDIFISNSKQEIIQSLENTIYLKVRNEKNITEEDDAPVASYLDSSYFITSDKYEIQEVAAKYKKQFSDRDQLAKSLEKWVEENIKLEPFKTNISPAYRSVLELKGSSEERNMVLVSLFRAAKIPSRLIVGLKYNQAPQDSFGYYIWVEAYIKGKWTRFDASAQELAGAPIYIGLKDVNLNNKEDRTSLILDVIKKLPNYKIKVLNVTSSISKELASLNSKLPVKQEFNLLEILRSGDKYITELKTAQKEADKQKELQKEDYLQKGILSAFSSDYQESIDNFEKASSMYSYGDDFNNMNYALQMASFGLFSVSQEYLNQIYDAEIWSNQVQTLESIYFPKNTSKEKEKIYLQAISDLKFDKNNFDFKKEFENDAFKKDETAQMILGLKFYKDNEVKKASKAFKKAIKLNKNNLAYKLKLAQSYLKENKPKGTLKLIKDLESKKIADKAFDNEVEKLKYKALSMKNKKEAHKRYYLAKYCFLTGDDKKAVELLSQNIEDDFHHSKTYSLLGKLSFESGDTNEAKAYMEKALTLDDKDVQALVLKANMISAGTKNSREKIKAYRKVLSIDSDNKEARLNIAMIQKENLRDYRAIHTLEKIKPENMDDEIFYSLAQLYLTVGDKESAIENLKKALSWNPSNDKCWFKLCELYLNDKNTFIAKSYLKPLKKINPNYKYYYYMGLIEKLNENHKLAQEFFEKSIELNPESKAKEEL